MVWGNLGKLWNKFISIQGNTRLTIFSGEAGFLSTSLLSSRTNLLQKVNLCYCQLIQAFTDNENIMEQMVQTDGAENDVEMHCPATDVLVSSWI